MQFTAVETNGQPNRIITLVVVPPSGEQLRGTNLVLQPNVTIKPTSMNYPVVSVVSADYDVYLAGLKQVFRIAVPDTNVVQRWDLLIKNGLTTYNYTNPLPNVVVSNTVVNLNTIIAVNITTVTLVVSNAFFTNLYATYVTNLTSYTTNLYATYTTIINPGGFTNANLDASSLVATDDHKNQVSIPNAPGFLTNNGAGLIGWNTVLAVTELDAQNAYLTNTFFFLTNVPYLATDGDGKVIRGAGLSPTNILLVAGANMTFVTNVDGSVTISSASALSVTTITNTTIYSSTNYATNLFFVSGKGNTLIVTNITIEVGGGFTNKNWTASTILWSAADKSAQSIANGTGFLHDDGAGGFAWSAVDLSGANASGILAAARFPVLTGDITTSSGALATTLKNTGTAGTYTKPTFDAQGRETSGTSAVLASSDFANQGTTTTVLHGNGSGNPSFGSVVDADISGALSKNTSGTATFVTQPAILSFASASNSIAMSTNINNVYFFVASTAVSLTNVTGSIAGQMTYADLVVSNSLATSITNYETIPGAKIFGVNSAGTATNALIIAAGKEGLWHLECRGSNETNAFNCVQQ